MSEYYKATELADGVFHIYEPAGVYTTLIIGKERALLIDTGYGFGNLAEYVRTLTDKPFDVVLTHGHTDHCGGNYEFPVVHMNLMDTPTYLWYEVKQKSFIADYLIRDHEAGRPRVWPENFDIEEWKKVRTRHFEPLKNGQIFDLGGRKEEIYFIPGHTVGSIVVYDTLTRLLFSGDNLSDSQWMFFNTSASVSEYAAGLMDIGLMPLRGVVASHKGFIFPPEIIQEMRYAISCINPASDKKFAHPRTGQKALSHKEPCQCVADIKNIYIVYDKNKL